MRKLIVILLILTSCIAPKNYCGMVIVKEESSTHGYSYFHYETLTTSDKGGFLSEQQTDYFLDYSYKYEVGDTIYFSKTR